MGSGGIAPLCQHGEAPGMPAFTSFSCFGSGIGHLPKGGRARCALVKPLGPEGGGGRDVFPGLEGEQGPQSFVTNGERKD